jgi:hypothetical protein
MNIDVGLLQQELEDINQERIHVRLTSRFFLMPVHIMMISISVVNCRWA